MDNLHSCRSSQGICWNLESQEDLSSKVASRGDLSEVRTVIRKPFKASKQMFGQSRQGNTSGNETQLGDRATSPRAVLVHSSITRLSVWDKTANICWAGMIRFVSFRFPFPRKLSAGDYTDSQLYSANYLKIRKRKRTHR